MNVPRKFRMASLPPTKPNQSFPLPTSAWKTSWPSRAQAIVEEAKAKATEEGNKIIAAAKVEAEQQTVKARESLREQVAALAVKGAEQILRKEVNAGVHADLLGRLKTEL